jgi:hypothetical protein
MENKYLVLIVIVIISIFAIVSVFGLSYIISSLPDSIVKIESKADLPLKNETFDGVKIAVPADSTFRNIDPNITYPKSFESDGYGIFIDTYIVDSRKKDIDYLIPSFIEMNNLTEINLEGLPKNAKAYANPASDDIIEIFVINTEGNKAVYLMVMEDEKYAVKMANSVVFPN